MAAVSALDERNSLAFSADGRYIVATSGSSGAGGPTSVSQVIANLLPVVGVDGVLCRMVDPVSVVIWDEHERTLTLARDRMGQADIYFMCGPFGLVFSSELKTLRQEAGGPPDVDPQAISQLFRYGYIPAPLTSYRGIYKLPAGTMRVFHLPDVHGGYHGGEAAGRLTPHWSLKEEAEAQMASREPCGIDRSVERVVASLERAICTARTGSTATLLSGGVDSSLVTALLQRHSEGPVETISVGFDDPGHDESEWAAAVAHLLGARNTRLVMEDANAIRLVERMPRVFCEPYADSSAIPTLLAAEAAGARCSTILTGDGGDELFFGHASYVKSLRNFGLVRHVPLGLRRACGAYAFRSPERARLGGIPALMSEAKSRSLAETYLARVSRWRDPSRALKSANEPVPPFLDAARHPAGGHQGELLLYLDQTNELSEGLMTKSDRAFGAFGVQARSPFLDPGVVSLAWGTPFENKLREGETKVVLKRALERFLPEHHARRPKKGFGAPVARWLNGPLRDWAEDLLDPIAMRNRGILDEQVVSTLWTSFLNGNRKYHTHLWPVLMFQAWDREWNRTNAP
nr:asparagine synthase C-terminal domain-containing protein [Stenotrophomonas sp. ISL-67]